MRSSTNQTLTLPISSIDISHPKPPAHQQRRACPSPAPALSSLNVISSSSSNSSSNRAEEMGSQRRRKTSSMHRPRRAIPSP
eukprot:1138556-Pelagomonas_calceolata.AAC.2